MSKITKKELLKRIEALEEFSTYADNMLTELNHALPDRERSRFITNNEE